MSNENFEAKKIISNAMGVVSMEIIGSRDHVEEVWKAISHAVDISYSVNDFYYPIRDNKPTQTINYVSL